MLCDGVISVIQLEALGVGYFDELVPFRGYELFPPAHPVILHFPYGSKHLLLASAHNPWRRTTKRLASVLQHRFHLTKEIFKA